MRTPGFACALVWFTGAALLAAPQGAPAQKHLLRYAFEEGKTAHAVMGQHMSMKMDVAGQSIDTVMDSQLHFSSTIAAVKDGKASIQSTLDRVVMKVKAPSSDVDFDSDVKGSDPGDLAPLAAIVGKKMEAEVDTRGKISALTLPEELKGPMKQAFDVEEITKKQFQTMPESPVAVGETWDSEIEMTMGQAGPSKIKVKNKLAEVVDGKARIEQVMQFDLGGLGLPGDMKMEVEKSTASTTIDLGHWSVPAVTIDIVMTAKGNGADMRMEISTTTKAGEAPKKSAGAAPADPPGGK